MLSEGSSSEERGKYRTFILVVDMHRDLKQDITQHNIVPTAITRVNINRMQRAHVPKSGNQDHSQDQSADKPNMGHS